jgi:hypothetical protein
VNAKPRETLAPYLARVIVDRLEDWCGCAWCGYPLEYGDTAYHEADVEDAPLVCSRECGRRWIADGEK